MSEAKWYTLQTLSGKEMKAKSHLEARLKEDRVELEANGTEGQEAAMDEKIIEVLVPQIKITKMVRKDGKERKQTRIHKFYPGYIFIKLDLLDINGKLDKGLWHFVKDTNGIINFLGGESPVVVPESDIVEIKAQVEGSVDAPSRVEFAVGELVKIKDGPFEGFEGEILAIDQKKEKLEISASIFGRATSVDVEYAQVEKVEN